MLKMRCLFLTLLLLCSCVQQENSTESAAVEPGVSEELARRRAESISNVNYRLRLNVPAGQNEPIDANLTLSFRLNDASADVQLDFRENEESVHDLNVNGVDAQIIHYNEHLLLEKRNQR